MRRRSDLITKRPVGGHCALRSSLLAGLPGEIDINAHDLDGAIGTELRDDSDRVHESPRRDQDAVVRSTLDERRQVVEARGEGVDNGEQFDRQEVGQRRLAEGTAIRAENLVELFERPLSRP